MKIFEFEKKIDPDIIRESFSARDGDVFFDIETTGLSRRISHIYMIGTGILDCDIFKVRQFFAETVKEERFIIKEFLNYLPDKARLVSYNGDRFDIPFVSEKSAAFSQKLNDGHIISFDIYKEIKGLKHLLPVPGLRQKDVERFLSIDREDIYDGGKLIKVYEDYQKRPDNQAENLLMLHNRDDVLGMIALLPILKYKKIRDADYKVSDFEISGDGLLFFGKSDLDIPKSLRLHDDNIYLILEKNSFKGSLTIDNGIYKKYFSNVNDYIYLIEEGKIVPKILKSGLDKYKYRKPVREECCVDIPVECIDCDFIANEILNFIRST